ncbi:MAG: glycosyltransferase [Chloroflexota bacterium]|nr:glycosyltransferase [Chloroflexota bacterium]
MDRPLRVAVVGESYLPYRSGVTIATEALADGLVAAGHEVLLVVPRPASGHAPRTDGPAPEIAWLPSYQGPPPAPPGYRMPLPIPSAALRRAREFGPDVVHAQSPFVSGLMGRGLARQTGAALVFTHHTRFGDYRHYLGPLAGPGAALMQAYLRRFWAGCAAIVAPSTDLAAEIAESLRRLDGSPRLRPIIRAIATGLDLDVFAALSPVDPRPLSGWPPLSTVVVLVGRLAREKSVDLLVDAFAEAARDNTNLYLLLVGDGPLRAELAGRASRPPLAGRMHLTGGLPRLEALALAAGGDLLAFASRTETQGLVLAEALACGLPVVALDGPGVGDSVRDGIDGVILPRLPGDSTQSAAERLGAAIGAVAADSQRRATLAAGAREGAYRFDLRTRIQEVVTLYQQVVALG